MVQTPQPRACRRSECLSGGSRKKYLLMGSTEDFGEKQMEIKRTDEDRMAFDSSFEDAEIVSPVEIVKFQGMSIETCCTKSGPLDTEPKAARDGSNATLNLFASAMRESDELRRSSEHIEDHRLPALMDELKDLTCDAVDVLTSIGRDAQKMLSRIEAGETISKDELVVFLKNIIAAVEAWRERREELLPVKLCLSLKGRGDLSSN